MACATSPMDHASWMLEGLNSQRKENVGLCDIDIIVQKSKSPAHRAVLCRASEYFNAMLTGHFVENDAKEVDLSNMIEKPDTLEKILDYIYTGNLEISAETVVSLLHGTSLLLLDRAKKLCVTFLFEHLTVDNCIKTLILAEKYDICDLSKIILEILCSRCHDDIIHSDQLISVPVEILAFLMEQGVFKHVTEENLLSFIQNCLISETFEKEESEAKVEHLQKMFATFSDASTVIKEAREKLIVPLTPKSEIKKISTVLSVLGHMIEKHNKQLNEKKLTRAVSELSVASGTQVLKDEEVVLLCSMGESGLSTQAKMYAYLTISKVWVELVNAEIPYGTLGRSAPEGNLIGIDYTSGINICFRHALGPNCDANIFNPETDAIQRTFIDQTHECNKCSDGHNFFCFGGNLYCLTRIKMKTTTKPEMVSLIEYYKYAYLLLKCNISEDDPKRKWTEVMKFDEDTDTYSDLAFSVPYAFQTVVSENCFDILVAYSTRIGPLDIYSSGDRKKLVYIHHFDKITDCTFSHRALPPVTLDNVTQLELNYKLAASKGYVYLVPIHSRMVCTSANMYKFNLSDVSEHSEPEWKICIVDSSMCELAEENTTGMTGQLTKMVVKTVPNSVVVSIPRMDVGVNKKDSAEKEDNEEITKHAEEVVGNVTFMPGGLLPIILKKTALLNRVQKVMSFDDSHEFLKNQGFEQVLRQTSEFAASGEHKLLYQTRVKGPYVTELWAYHIESAEWECLPSPPIHHCLDVKVGRLPISILQEKTAMKFDSRDMLKTKENSTGLFQHYILMSDKEYKESGGKDEATEKESYDDNYPDIYDGDMYGMYGYDDDYDDYDDMYDDPDDYDYEPDFDDNY